MSDLLNTEDHIQYLFGYPDGTFGPENNMTRAEVAQMRRRFLVLYNREEKAGGLAEMQALLT